MAYKLVKCEYCACLETQIKEFICDTDADVDVLPQSCTGSKALSVASGSTYVVNASGNWVPLGGGIIGGSLEGDGQEFHQFAPTTLAFRSTEPLEEFQEVQVNGETVDPENYDLEEGSTIVKFKPDYLKTLGNGSHKIAIVSKNNVVSGNFDVKVPEVNEHGFYYNQPYTAVVDAFGCTTVFFLREEGTMDIIMLEDGYTETCRYETEGNNLTVFAQGGTFTASATADSIYCNELATAFVLGNESIAADEDYIYIYKEELGGYEVKCIDKTKASYGEIKTGINGLPTRWIDTYAFLQCENLTSITIPSCIEFIADNAFGACFNLDEVIIENCKVYINGNPFPDSPLSKGISLKHSYLKSDYVCDICKHCEHLHTELVGKTDEYSGDVICNDCGKTVTKGGYCIPAGATYYVARTGETLTEGDIFPTISELSKNDIYTDGQCQYTYGGQSWSLTDANQDVSYVSIAESINKHRVTSIGSHAFDGCSNLTKITIPDSVTTIGGFAFYSCSNLTSIMIPNSVTSIGYRAFGGCSKILQESSGVSYVNNWIVDCSDVMSVVTIRDGIIGISDSAFNNCYDLSSLSIPDGVKYIGNSAFSSCNRNLKSITIPDSVISIGKSAFYNCSSLISIIFEGTIAQWNAINKGQAWITSGSWGAPATHVQCTDGTVAL